MPLNPDRHRALGATLGMAHGTSLPRHYGDPEAEYRAAVEGVAAFDRSYRSRLGVAGRSPLRMLQGVATGRMPSPPEELSEEVRRGRAEYSAVLTAKGKLISDLRILRLSDGEDSELLLDVPWEGTEGLVAHLSKFLPPRYAALQDRSESTGMLSLVGPGAAPLISELLMEGKVPPGEVADLAEGDLLQLEREDGPVQVIRTSDVAPLAFDVIAGHASWETIWTSCIAQGARPAGQGVWETLRVEAGRPAFGVDMNEKTIPFEAGIVDRAVDHTKGCYTGQEVIVRIRDRGHVNRHLRGFRMGDAPVPAVGDHVFDAESKVGTITSGVTSPRFGTLALGYLRREVELPAELCVQNPGGTPAVAIELNQEGWPGSQGA